MTSITLPHNFTPRSYQLPSLKALDSGVKRLVAVWHRRAGKEKTFINYTAKRMAQRVGAYFYIFPTYTQAKKAIWDGRDKDGFPFLGHFPAELVAHKNESELKLTYLNGSIFQLVGSDSIDALMSTNPIGCVFAEYALQDPRAWDYMRPILRENGGWAIFDFVPRGKNHAYDMYDLAKRLQAEGDKDWFCELLTVNDTGALTPGDIEQERREGMDEDMIQQEYYCSFAGVQQGAVYGRQMSDAESEKRICAVPWHPEARVDTWWDLGVNDATSIWFTQDIGREIHFIDYLEESGKGLPWYAKALQDKDYVYGTHTGPHDIQVREFGSGKSRIEVAAALGIKFEVAPSLTIDDGINAARSVLGRCWFDLHKTARGRDALVSYHYTWDEKRKQFSREPYHDWSSNGADALRTLAVSHKGKRIARPAPAGKPRFVQTSKGATPDGQWMG